MVCGQKIALGRLHAGQTITVHVAETVVRAQVVAGQGHHDVAETMVRAQVVAGQGHHDVVSS
ncbi:hypothetical protein [Actinoallomurus sp. NPDC050550]|uniref:hypothetical protein n=1 Tax=Actinoallomurus sp. NPDC050550 TaxID=3154937 RepID=UPI0033F09162